MHSFHHIMAKSSVRYLSVDVRPYEVEFMWGQFVTKELDIFIYEKGLL